MTIKSLVNEIFEKSFSRESLERLLKREIALKIEKALEIECNSLPSEKSIIEILSETLKSE